MHQGRPDPVSRVVLVTGASSGIGRACAYAFAERGDVLVLAARSEQSLKEAALECGQRGAGSVTVIRTVVVDEESVGRLIDRTMVEHGRIDVVVHAATVMAYGRIEDPPTAVFTQVVDTAVQGTLHVARAVLPVFRMQEQGTLIVVNSLLGAIATPVMGAYVTAKWGQLGLTRVLQIETRDLPGVHVCTVSPGGVDTPIYHQAANYAGRVGRPPPPVDSPEKVARAILRCADRPRRHVSVGVANGIVQLGFTLVPGVYDALVTPLLERFALAREDVAPTDGNAFSPNPASAAVHGRWGRHWLRPIGVGAAVVAGTGAWMSARRVRSA